MFKNLSSFLEKFANIAPPERFVKEIFIRVVFEITKVSLKEEEIKISEKNIFLSSHPTKKSEIFLQKPILLKKINKELSPFKKTIQDIL